MCTHTLYSYTTATSARCIIVMYHSPRGVAKGGHLPPHHQVFFLKTSITSLPVLNRHANDYKLCALQRSIARVASECTHNIQLVRESIE